jgi:VanZ family protein
MYKNIFIGLLVISSFASASNGFKSELSHFIGGLIMAALVAYLVFKYSYQYKSKSVLIGFLVSSFYVTIDQLIDYVKDGEFLNQLLDFSVHIIGAIIGAYLISLYLRKLNKPNKI